MPTRTIPVPVLSAMTALLLCASPAARADFYVDDDAPPGGDGSSWATALNSLDDAIDLQFDEPSASIHVAQGTYVPQGNLAYPSTFLMYNAYGGYAGYDAPDPDLRDPEAFPTILSGDVNGDDTSDFQNLADNLPAVVNLVGIVDGFVITGAAGGVEVYDGNLADRAAVVRGCRFHHNSAGFGGACVADRDARFERCVFEDNRALREGQTFEARGTGGAVFVRGTNVKFHACRFSRNHALFGGAVGVFSSGSGSFSSCVFTANEASDPERWCAGGAIGVFVSSPSGTTSMEHCVVYGNRTSGLGGGLCHLNGRADYRNCVFWDNTDAYGQGMTAQANLPPQTNPAALLPQVTNIVQGAPLMPPAALPALGGAAPMFMDPLGPDGVLGTDDDDFRPVYGSPLIDAGGIGHATLGFTTDFRGLPRVVDDPATPNVAYAAVTGLADIGAYEYQEDCDGNGVVDSLDILNGTLADCDANGIPDACEAQADCNENGENDRCDIGSGSSQDCNGNGVPDECDIASGFSTDDNGNGTPDECEPATLYVDASAGERGAGAWAGAYGDLQSALHAAADRHASTEIWVAQGTYTPGSDRNSSFKIPAHTTVLGGFAGTEASAAERDPSAHETILSGDLDGNDDPGDDTTFDDNVQNVVSMGSPGGVLDGLTISGGFSRVQDGVAIFVFLQSEEPDLPDITVTRTPGDSGGALRHANVEGTLRGCTLRGNRASAGSVVDVVGGAKLAMVGCVVEGNHTTKSGGRIFGLDEFQSSAVSYSGFAGYPEGLPALDITDSWIHDNAHLEPETNGYLVKFGQSLITLRRTLVAANAFDAIIDVYAGLNPDQSSTRVHLDNSAIVANDAAAVRVERNGYAAEFVRQLIVRNSTIAQNMGGIEGRVMTDVQNSILWANGGDELSTLMTAPYSTLRYNTIEGWDPLDDNGSNIDANIPDDPMFVDPAGPDATPGTGDEDFHLMAGSTSIDSGDANEAPLPLGPDLDGNPRFVDDPAAPNTGPMYGLKAPIDRGAYERQVASSLTPGDIDGDRHVNIHDFAILASNFGRTNTPGIPGDLDGDADVDVSDFAILASAFE